MRCRNCGRAVSPRADACPSCGEPIRAKQSTGGVVWDVLVTLFVIFVAIPLLLALLAAIVLVAIAGVFAVVGAL